MTDSTTEVTAEALTRGVLRVGHGRGFVVELNGQRVVISAAHCWGARLPHNHVADYQVNRTRRLLGLLGGKQTVWTELLFGDPIADIAVLGAPDDQIFPEQYFAYEQLLDAMQPLAIADAPVETRNKPGTGSMRLLSLDGTWVEGQAERRGWCLWVRPAEITAPGMSGSPIINSAGAAIGVVVSGGPGDSCLNPVIVDRLPAGFLQKRKPCTAKNNSQRRGKPSKR